MTGSPTRFRDAVTAALAMAGIAASQIAGAGFGVAGYDWPSEREATLQAVRPLGIEAPIEVVNDTLVGLLAGRLRGMGGGRRGRHRLQLLGAGIARAAPAGDRPRHLDGRGGRRQRADLVCHRPRCRAHGRGAVPPTRLTQAFIEPVWRARRRRPARRAMPGPLPPGGRRCATRLPGGGEGDAVARGAIALGRPRAGQPGRGGHPPARV